MASKGAATRVVIAGFTSRVAQLITSYLLRQPDLEIVGICRNAAKVSEEVARNPKITVREAEYSDSKALRNALHGASVCICCYFGPEPVMLEGQFLLIDSCIAENVPRYIASDFSFDYRGLKIGDFPFKDFQAKVGDYLAEKERQGQIKAVHVLNGGFFEAVLFPFMGLLDVQGKRFRCWGTGDEPWDMTSMEDTAMFTAKVASDHSATGVLKGKWVLESSFPQSLIAFQSEETASLSRKWRAFLNDIMVSVLRWNNWAQLKSYRRR